MKKIFHSDKDINTLFKEVSLFEQCFDFCEYTPTVDFWITWKYTDYNQKSVYLPFEISVKDKLIKVIFNQYEYDEK